MKALLALDIVHPVKPIAEHLAGLLSLKETDLTLVYVKEELPSYEKVAEAVADFEEDWGRRLDAKAHEVLEEAASVLKPNCDKVSLEIVSGPAALMIESVARDEGFDIIGIAPAHHGKMEKLFIGSVTSNVVKHGPCSVLILRPNGKPAAKLEKVLIAVDGSDQSRLAVKNAGKLFNLKDSEITLIHVVNVAEVFKMFSPVEYISFVENNLLLKGETYLAEAQELLAEQGLRHVSCVLKEGDPAFEITSLSRSLPADLIITGDTGWTNVKHFLLGSVSHKVVMQAPCSCAVVKAK